MTKQHKISETKVMKSNAGYYIGDEYYDEECECWFPNTRYSEYFKTREIAEKWLPVYKEA